MATNVLGLGFRASGFWVRVLGAKVEDEASRCRV